MPTITTVIVDVGQGSNKPINKFTTLLSNEMSIRRKQSDYFYNWLMEDDSDDEEDIRFVFFLAALASRTIEEDDSSATNDDDDDDDESESESENVSISSEDDDTSVDPTPQTQTEQRVDVAKVQKEVAGSVPKYVQFRKRKLDLQVAATPKRIKQVAPTQAIQGLDSEKSIK